MVRLIGLQIDLALARCNSRCLTTRLRLPRHKILNIGSMGPSPLNRIFSTARDSCSLAGRDARGYLYVRSLATRLRTLALMI